ncbi:nucleoside-diphosphate sugar epimerase [Cellulomonas chitinilytica]|uniref:Nucleoside-diphosphate sugar epimerase n=1 Tax=Cellulomonas chitinilytica TaxID=398759 RepID=A0A919P6B1_9CELL|nr:NAD-dependent epimerase/dehydratase family protein [Cellulomonas chitinilytica]GIG22937.1 nucleoside-diphosphate sugar epimerase [Cellulomonas chitinilytica]
MRVVVVGASGNVGTALLRRFMTDPTVTSVVGVARRVPHGLPPLPYRIASWVACDLGEGVPDEPVVARLTDVFAGADAVVHLAWAVQPSHDRRRLFDVNVSGTRRVLAAVVRAGVPHVVAASSVGAYSPAPDDVPRAEGWPTDGVRSSSYSLHKAAQERLLDETEATHPGLVVARLRPALVFQRDAGHEITRYFLGRFVPRALLDGRLPVLPWPSGLRLQAVHADDLADACREAVVRQVRGAFNVAAPGVLRGEDVADVIGAGAVREVAPSTVRAALAAAWHARAVAVGPGWLDLALAAPVLDTARAERELDLRPRWTAADAMREVVDGIVAGDGTASPPLLPRRLTRHSASHG